MDNTIRLLELKLQGAQERIVQLEKDMAQIKKVITSLILRADMDSEESDENLDTPESDEKNTDF